MNALAQTNLCLIASARTWIDAEAVRQLCAVGKLEGVRLAVGLPDLQPGFTSPTGAAFVTEGIIHPHLIGGDIGCGFALWKTSLSRRHADLDRWADIRFDLEHPWEGNARARLIREELCATQFVGSFGTLGGGQHFAELQAVESVFQPALVRRLGLAKEQLVLLVHAGSRDFGCSVMETHVEEHGAGGADPASGVGTRYRLLHDHALRWATANRAVLAERFLRALDASGHRVLDACHNSITEVCTSGAGPRAGSKDATRVRNRVRPRRTPSPRTGMRGGNGFVGENEPTSLWLHRCGAAPADCGPLVIPGSSGVFSYLVQPISAGPAHAWSLARGAGRRWTRSEARVRVRERFEPEQLTQTGLGGRVLCGDRHRLQEEAPPAYKDVETVIADLLDAGLIEVIATLRPLLTYKTRAVRR